MRIIGCDLHALQQTLAMLDTTTGELVNRTLMHEGNHVREFYSELPHRVLVGIEAIGPMQWFLNLLEELGIECQVGDATKIRAAEPRKPKHDRRDAELLLKLLVEKRFPKIWMPSKELLDLRALLLHRHHWVHLRTQIQNALQAIALAHGLRRGPGLWSFDGQAKIAFLPLCPHASYRRSALQSMYRNMKEQRAWARHVWQWPASWAFDCGSCRAIRSNYQEFCRHGNGVWCESSPAGWLGYPPPFQQQGSSHKSSWSAVTEEMVGGHHNDEAK